MPKTFSLTAKQHDEPLTTYRKDPDPDLRSRAHIILLLAEGYPWDTIGAMLCCSSRTVDRWLKRSQAGGSQAHWEEARPTRSLRPGMGRPPRLLGNHQDPRRLRLPP